jgi:diadenosine tetraphosphate (Ap4A) HIT family hydrolase
MHNGSRASLDTEASHNDCAFCQQSTIAEYILKETLTFRVVADHAPLVEGHLLIIPKQHYACYGAVPAALDTELFALKREVQEFFDHFYAPVVYWEHGIFHQTVFHAHLHCFPFGETHYQLSEGLHDRIVHTQADIREWYTTKGQYFYLEDRHNAVLFAPHMDTYRHIIQEVLWSGVVSRIGNIGWRSPLQRQEEGVALIASLKEKWALFQQQRMLFS